MDATLRNCRKDWSPFWNSLNLRPITIGSDLLYLGILRDVSSIRQTEMALDRAAHLDVATGCLSRQSFIVAAEGRLATNGNPVLVVKLDVISFHEINAGYGFEIGDALLLEIGRRLRSTDADLVARIGANEFALAFGLADEASAQQIVNRVAAARDIFSGVQKMAIALRRASADRTTQPVTGSPERWPTAAGASGPAPSLSFEAPRPPVDAPANISAPRSNTLNHTGGHPWAAMARHLEQAMLERLLALFRRTPTSSTSKSASQSSKPLGRLLALLQQVRGDMQKTAAKQRSLMLQNSRVQFLPAISPSKSRIVFNTCALSAGFSFPSLSTFRAMAEPEQYAETLSQLDMMLLVSAVEALHHSSKQRGCCPVLVPVRLDSLRSHGFRDEYMKLLNAIPEKYGRFMLVEITGLSTAEDGLDVLFIAPEHQRYVKRLLIEVGLEAAEPLDPSELSVWGVSTSLAGWTSTDPRLPGRLRRYVQWAARKRLSTVEHGVNSLGLALQAQKAGFSGIDGPAVHPVATHPKPSFSVAPLDRAGTAVSVPHRKEL